MFSKKIRGIFPWFAFCLAGVALNVAGARLVALLGLPLYLDCQGTVLAAAVGGFLPGIVVGYLSNLINSIYDPISIFYCVTSVMIAVSATVLYRKGFFRRFPGFLLPVLIFAFLGGGIGSVMGWILYGFDISNGISGPLALQLHATGLCSPFLAKLAADFYLDIADKLLTVLFTMLALRVLPHSLERVLGVPLLRGPQSDRGAEGWTMSQSVPVRGLSLRAKISLLISAAFLLLAVAGSCVTFLLYRQVVLDDHARLGQGTAELAASAIDGSAVERYLSQGEDAEGYRETESILRRILDTSPDIAYIYAYRFLPDGCQVVFDLDTEDEPGDEPGEFIDLDPSLTEYLPALLDGEAIEPVITNDSYGWLLTAYVPVCTDAGECVCYAAADISMMKIRNNEVVFMARELSLYFGLFIVILALALWLAEGSIIAPINAIARAAGTFAYDSEEARAENVKAVRRLELHTGDEIENLYRAILKNAEDTMRYIADSQKKAGAIARMQSGLILTLADLVESRDKNTGNHVRKTAAYAELIMRQMSRDGVYPEALTAEFMAEVASAAPLHDLGKIHVSDTILNKPDKLTNVEFREMRGHTWAGQKIIERVMKLSPDSSYLKEARNLAAFHHERWDGTGYPCGLAGENIPLSARIMAVADVFDALVSRRSYKEPFPFEEAIQMIREGSGTQFDPQIVEAFLRAEPEARQIEEAFQHSDL